MTTALAHKRELTRLSSAKQGERVEFFYYGHGDYTGSNREATVLEVRRDGVLAVETDGDHPKYFKDREARDIFVLDEGVGDSRVRFDAAIAKIVELGIVTVPIAAVLTGEQLAKIYGEYVLSGQPASFDELTGDIVFDSPVKTNKDARFTEVDARHLCIRKGNEELDIYLNSDGTVELNNEFGDTDYYVTPVRFANEIKRFVLDK